MRSEPSCATEEVNEGLISKMVSCPLFVRSCEGRVTRIEFSGQSSAKQ